MSVGFFLGFFKVYVIFLCIVVNLIFFILLLFSNLFVKISNSFDCFVVCFLLCCYYVFCFILFFSKMLYCNFYNFLFFCTVGLCTTAQMILCKIRARVKLLDNSVYTPKISSRVLLTTKQNVNDKSSTSVNCPKP